MQSLRIVARFQRFMGIEASDARDLEVVLEATLEVLGELAKKADRFPAVLRQAEKEADGLPSGVVWQPRLVEFFEDLDPLEQRFQDFDDKFAELYAAREGLISNVANAARKELRQPRKAMLGHAVSDLQFFDHPKLGKDYIAYGVGTLKEWAQAYGKWLADATRGVLAQLKKAQKK